MPRLRFPFISATGIPSEKGLVKARQRAKGGDYRETTGAYDEPVFVPQIKSDAGDTEMIQMRNKRNMGRVRRTIKRERRMLKQMEAEEYPFG